MNDPNMPLEVDPRPDHLKTAKSLVLINTGDGKGKSTAAFGTMMRAVARGWKVCVVQFLKSGEWSVGEEAVARQLGVDWQSYGEGFTWDSQNLSIDEAIAQKGWEVAEAALTNGDYGLVVLDEITYPINFGWIDIERVTAAIMTRFAGTSVIITGRDAGEALIELADTVTEMRKVKHAYDAGIVAKKGIDY